MHLDTVRAWRGRFAHGGLSALADRKRSGRPARFAPVQIAETKALACQLPAETGVPLSRWSCPELAAELTARGITDTVSASTVRRWLREDVLKPWQYRSWIFNRGPDFRAKAQGPVPAEKQLRFRPDRGSVRDSSGQSRLLDDGTVLTVDRTVGTHSVVSPHRVKRRGRESAPCRPCCTTRS
ncbi:helix-turn-helix domain-containing protein [Kitasatospora sp. NPDC004669]|uniref:helix-turn-helix domain-containing protein n=1 Tax=Kitasatospora sp. NPDC004669 TaxID=3154555 RepID=UPI0033B33D53